jgi:uroporphyrinogen-III synthase
VSAPVILLTRPEAESAALAERLAAQGWQPLLWPVLTVVGRPGQPEATGAQAVLLTSANAARALPAALLNPLPPLCLCVGNATATVARAAGYRGVEAAGGDGADLAEAVVARLDPRAGALLFPRGEDVAGDLAGCLRGAGFEVRESVVYAAEPAGAPPEPVARALIEGRVAAVALYSPRSAAVFAAEARRFGPALGSLRAVAISAKAAAPLDGLGLAAVRVARTPTQAGMLEEIEAVREDLDTAAHRGDVRLGGRKGDPLR